MYTFSYRHMVLGAVIAAACFSGASFAENAPYTCHWTGDVSSDWFNPNNWAEGVVPGVYRVTTTNANDEVIVTTNGCRGCTAVFGRVPNDNLNRRRLIRANPYGGSYDIFHLLSIGNIVFTGAADPEHPDWVFPAYFFGNSLSWQWAEPYMPLESGGRIRADATVTESPTFMSAIILGSLETTTQTYYFQNDAPVPLKIRRFSAAPAFNVKAPGNTAWLSNTLRFEGTGEIDISHGNIGRSMQEYSWSLAMSGGKVHATGSSTFFQLLVPTNVPPQELAIDANCLVQLNCENSRIAGIQSYLKVTGEGFLCARSGTGANRQLQISGNGVLEIAGGITNTTAGTFAEEAAGLYLQGRNAEGAGTFKVTGRNCAPGALQLALGLTLEATSIGRVGGTGPAGGGQRIRLEGGGVRYMGTGEVTDKSIKLDAGSNHLVNNGTGDLVFAALEAGNAAYDVTISSTNGTAIGFQGTIAGHVVLADDACLLLTNCSTCAVAALGFGANSTVRVADGVTATIATLAPKNDSARVDFVTQGSGRVIVADATAGAAPATVRLNGVPARYDASGALVALTTDDLTIAARGAVVPNVPAQTVAITTPGSGSADTLADDATAVLLLRQRETTTPAVIALGNGQTFTANWLEVVNGAQPLVFAGAGDLLGTFSLMGGPLVRTNETTGAAITITPADEATVKLEGALSAERPLVAALSAGALTVETSSVQVPATTLEIGADADVTFKGAQIAATNRIKIATSGTAKVVVGEGSSISGRLTVACTASDTLGKLVQTGGEVHNALKGDTFCAIGAHGYYELSGGTLINYGTANLGYTGVGVMAQYGGTIAQTNGSFAVVGRTSGFSVFYQKAGLLLQTTPGLDLYCGSQGQNGSGVWTIEGSNALTRVRSATDGRNFVLAAATSSSSGTNATWILNLNNGGILHAGTVQCGKNHAETSKGYLNFNGGILRNNYAWGALFGQTGATYFDPLDRVTLFENGATIMTDGVSCHAYVPLRAPTGQGVSAIPWSDTATTFAVAPAVRIVGDGFGASAFADYDSTTETVTGIHITSPGCDYTEAFAEILYGTRGALPVVRQRIPCTLAANVSGGLTKTGSGNFTLHATNTYTGATVIQKGRIVLDAPEVINPASELVLDGGSLDLGGFPQTFANIRVTSAGGQILNGTPTLTGLTADLRDLAAGNYLKLTTPITFADGAVITLTHAEEAGAKLAYPIADLKGGFTGTVTLAAETQAALPRGHWRLEVVGTLLRLANPRGMTINFR